jgi:purine-binding chemotaxis protein CheW
MEQTAVKSGSTQLSFRLAEETYAIEILKVREIIGLMDITAVPLTAGHIRGVVNLRGKIVPVLDMRAKFGLPPAAARRENCIITVMAQGAKGGQLVGILVDSVSEVVKVADEELEALPDLGAGASLDFVVGLAKAQGRVTILLDIDRVVQNDSLQGMAELEQALQHAGAPALDAAGPHAV